MHRHDVLTHTHKQHMQVHHDSNGRQTVEIMDSSDDELQQIKSHTYNISTLTYTNVHRFTRPSIESWTAVTMNSSRLNHIHTNTNTLTYTNETQVHHDSNGRQTVEIMDSSDDDERQPKTNSRAGLHGTHNTRQQPHSTHQQAQQHAPNSSRGAVAGANNRSERAVGAAAAFLEGEDEEGVGDYGDAGEGWGVGDDGVNYLDEGAGDGVNYGGVSEGEGEGEECEEIGEDECGDDINDEDYQPEFEDEEWGGPAG